MTPHDFLEFLGLPPGVRVDRVVPKKLLIENGSPTAADRKAISAGIEKIHWLAALKPSGIGVPEYRDDTRQYVEIAIVAMTVRPGAKLTRLSQLLHRAIPYPVLLSVQAESTLQVSVAEKRFSERQAEKFVLESDVVGATLPNKTEVHEAFNLSAQPKDNLRALYLGWRSVIEAVQASAITGRFVLLSAAEKRSVRRQAIDRHDFLVAEIASLRKLAVKERQMARRVELNLQIEQLQSELQQTKELL